MDRVSGRVGEGRHGAAGADEVGGALGGAGEGERRRHAAEGHAGRGVDGLVLALQRNASETQPTGMDAAAEASLRECRLGLSTRYICGGRLLSKRTYACADCHRVVAAAVAALHKVVPAHAHPHKAAPPTTTAAAVCQNNRANGSNTPLRGATSRSRLQAITSRMHDSTSGSTENHHMLSHEACAQSRGTYHAGGAKGGRRELAVVGKGPRAARERDGQQALVEAVLRLRERQLVGVAAEGGLEVPRHLMHHREAADERKGERAGKRGVAQVRGRGAGGEGGEEEQQQCRGLRPRERGRRLGGCAAPWQGSFDAIRSRMAAMK